MGGTEWSTLTRIWGALGAQWSRVLLPTQGTQVGSLNWEDPLEEEMAPHSSILAWEVLWTESLVGYSPLGPKRVRHDLVTKTNNINLIAYKCLVRKISLGIGV